MGTWIPHLAKPTPKQNYKMKKNMAKICLTLACLLAMAEACSMVCGNEGPRVCDSVTGQSYTNECHWERERVDAMCQLPPGASYGPCSDPWDYYGIKIWDG